MTGNFVRHHSNSLPLNSIFNNQPETLRFPVPSGTVGII